MKTYMEKRARVRKNTQSIRGEGSEDFMVAIRSDASMVFFLNIWQNILPMVQVNQTQRLLVFFRILQKSESGICHGHP